MIKYKNRTHNQRYWPLWRCILTGLNVLALILSAILSWHFLKGGAMVGCGGGSPCEQVLNSRWSMIAGGLPVSGLADGAYLAMLVASFFTHPARELPVRRLAWSVMLILSGAIAGSAVWFIIIQKWIIGDFCLYCMATHIIGLLLTILVIKRALVEFSSHSNNNLLPDSRKIRNIFSSVTGLIFTGLIISGLLAVSQMNYTPSAKSLNSQPQMPSVDYHTVPMVGNPEAPYIVTLLFDYQCSHCQKIHFILNEVVRRYNGKLGFVLCPAPLNSRCNPYILHDTDAFRNSCEQVRIALAVWIVSREAFEAYENWIFTFESGDRWHPRSLEAARAKAIELVEQAKFDAALSTPWIEQYMQTCINIYGQTIQGGKGGIPKLIFGSHWIIPEVYNADELILILQENLNVPKP